MNTVAKLADKEAAVNKSAYAGGSFREGCHSCHTPLRPPEMVGEIMTGASMMVDAARTPALLRTKGPAFVGETVINFVLPYLIYSYAEPSLGDVQALLASSGPPIVWSLVEFIRRRRLDALSLFVLAGIILSLLAFFGGGGARMLQLREKLVTGVIGLAFLVSAAIGRPVIYELAKAGMSRSGSADLDRMHRLRDDRRFRRSMTIMTVVWGFGLLLDVAIGASLVFSLTIKQYLLVNPIEGYVVLGGLSLWTFWYSKRSKARNDALRGADPACTIDLQKGG